MRKFLLLIIGVSLNAALPTGITWEVRHAGSNNNGGGFLPGSSGTDYSQQNSAQVAYTDLVIGATTTQYTSASNPVGNTVPGNVVQIISGSGCTAGFYYIVSNSTITATVDRSMGTAASTCTANLGGALGTWAGLTTALGKTNNIYQHAYIKADATYVITTGVSFANTSTNEGTATLVEGYNSTRGDGTAIANYPTLQGNAGSLILVTLNNNNNLFNFDLKNFTLDCNSQSASKGIVFNAIGQQLENIHIENCTGGAGFDSGSSIGVFSARNIWVSGQTGSGPGFILGVSSALNSVTMCMYCWATGGAAGGFVFGPSVNCIFCGAANNTGDGFSTSCLAASTITALGLTSYNNTGDGFKFAGDSSNGNCMIHVTNSTFVSNGGWGVENTGSLGSNAYNADFNYNAFYGNTSGAQNNIAARGNDVTLTGVPYTNAGSLDFSPNSTVGQGAALVGVGYPGATGFFGGTGHQDIGTFQHNPSSTPTPVVIPVQ